MPYRRLPNTDKARIRSLEMLLSYMRDNLAYQPVVPVNLKVHAEKILRDFKALSLNYNAALDRQNEFSRNETYRTRRKNARMYVSHYLTVLYLSSKRGEVKNSMAEYGIDVSKGALPDLSSDAGIIRCCENTIRLEKARQAAGGIPVYNPTIAKVTVHYDLFRDSWQKHAGLKRETDSILAQVAALRPEIDSVILEAWDSIEKFFAGENPETRLLKCQQCGVIYYYRKGEKTD